MPDDVAVPDIQLIENNSRRTPCVLVLDGSGSMRGRPVDELNEGLKVFESELRSDGTASLRIQVLVVRAGDDGEAEIISDWTDAMFFSAPTIEANGRSPLGAAMALALDKIAEQSECYDANGVPSTRPWIVLISDGIPTDPDWQSVADRCREAEANGKVAIFPIGTAEADLEVLGRFANEPARRLDGLRFRELFLWLSLGVAGASKAAPGATARLPATTEWAGV